MQRAIIHFFKSTKHILMKKLSIFIILITLFTSTIQAQSLKGKVGLGLGLGLINHSFTYPQTGNTLQVLPSIGYFVNDAWQLGIRGSFSSRQYKSSNMPRNEQDTYKNWLVELFGTHYQRLASKWFFFAEPSLGYTYQYATNTSNYSLHPLYNAWFTKHTIEANTRIGILFMVSSRFGININSKIFNLRYTKNNHHIRDVDGFNRFEQNTEETMLQTSFLVGANLSFLNQLQLGIHLFL